VKFDPYFPHLLSDMGQIPWRFALSADKHLCTSWKSAQKRSYYSYGHK